MKKTSPARWLTLPNCITAARIAGSLALIATLPPSTAFYVVYTLCGISDVLDGWIARATDSVTDLGSKLDSLADLLFYLVMLIKLLPVLRRLMPGWTWYVIAGILALRTASYVTAAVKFRKFSSMHTWLNKVTGGAVFLIPYALLTPFAMAYCFAVCAVAALASGQELVLHLTRREYQPNEKGFF